MRRRIKQKGAAMLAALAVLPWIGGYGLEGIPSGGVPLTIEVIEEETVAAAARAEAAQENPRVLIYHTHTWEAYEMTADTQYTPTETWRTKDNRFNMVRIGAELASCFESFGFSVTHDQSAFEPPDLSSSYSRSLQMLDRRIDAGETYDYIFDIHRDAYSGLYNGANAVGSGESSTAYVMLLVGKGTGATGSGFDERPDWPKNLELAQEITDEMNALLPGVSREVKIKPGRFNQHVSTGALLIEIGNNKNTLNEALAACPVIAQAIARVHQARQSD